jgi:hypothetical protein
VVVGAAARSRPPALGEVGGGASRIGGNDGGELGGLFAMDSGIDGVSL